jgi:hypothetical protein
MSFASSGSNGSTGGPGAGQQFLLTGPMFSTYFDAWASIIE